MDTLLLIKMKMTNTFFTKDIMVISAKAIIGFQNGGVAQCVQQGNFDGKGSVWNLFCDSNGNG